MRDEAELLLRALLMMIKQNKKQKKKKKFIHVIHTYIHTIHACTLLKISSRPSLV